MENYQQSVVLQSEDGLEIAKVLGKYIPASI